MENTNIKITQLFILLTLNLSFGQSDYFENFLGDEKRWRLYIASHYSNLIRENISKNNEPYLEMESGFTSVISVRHTIKKKLSIAIDPKFTSFFLQNYFPNSGVTSKNSEFKLQAVGLGIRYYLKPDAKWPGVFLSAGSNLWENYMLKLTDSTKDEYLYFQNLRLSILAYRQIDPIIISLNASYYIEKDRKVEDIVEKKANSFSLSQNTNFIVNENIALYFTSSFYTYQSYMREHESFGPHMFDLQFEFGTNMEINNIGFGIGTTMDKNYRIMFLYDF